MRIARPQPHAPPFRRKRTPPPQATKLLTYSLAAGLVFMVLLGVVFLPRMFIVQPPVATPVRMLFNGTTARLEVQSVGALVSLSKLQATLFRDGDPIATLGPPLGAGDAILSFMDSNGDGLLGPGDYFSVSTSGCNRVDVFQVEAGSTFLVGRSAVWGACSST